MHGTAGINCRVGSARMRPHGSGHFEHVSRRLLIAPMALRGEGTFGTRAVRPSEELTSLREVIATVPPIGVIRKVKLGS